jgi:RHS repeat-associated protein
MGAFAAAMVASATPSFAAGQPPREELNARVYQWRGEDQISAIVDATSGPKFYDHDRRGRLIRERRPDAVVDRAMDAVGNVYRSADGRDRRYGPGGHLEHADGVRYEHDEDGNQTLKSGPDGDWRYRWNGHGMLREVERPDGVRVQFEYDPFARRTAKRIVTPDATPAREVQFVWDGHNVVHELDSERGLISWQWEPESFTPIAKEHAGRRWTIASDHLGTPTEMYDEVGRLAWKMQLDVFGVPSFEAGTAEDCPWRWPGQYEDGGTGLFYNRYRYGLQSERYLSADPAAPLTGIRLYAYVVDVDTAADPFGLMPWRWAPDGMGHHLVSRGKAGSMGLELLASEHGAPTFFPIPYTSGDHELLHRAQRATVGKLQGPWSGTVEELFEASRQGLESPTVAHLRGDLRIPATGEIIARNVTPVEAFDALIRWHDAQLRVRAGCG